MLELNGFNVLKAESAGRYFPVSAAIGRGKMYNRPIFSAVEKFVNAFNLKDKKIFINPHYKMTIYARKIR